MRASVRSVNDMIRQARLACASVTPGYAYVRLAAPAARVLPMTSGPAARETGTASVGSVS